MNEISLNRFVYLSVLLLMALSLAPASPSFAADASAPMPQVLSAKMVDRNTVAVELSFGGGCVEHTFSLAFDGRCLESFPHQTSATVVDISSEPDFCKAFLTQTVELSIEGIGSCRPAVLGIKGANGTMATVQVPQ
jgi:hypothetical protein